MYNYQRMYHNGVRQQNVSVYPHADFYGQDNISEGGLLEAQYARQSV
jgi:hypothetical protein